MPAAAATFQTRRRPFRPKPAGCTAWVTVCYGEALANFAQPFWMVAVLGIMHLHPRHLVGFGLCMLCVMAPAVFLLAVLLGRLV